MPFIGLGSSTTSASLSTIVYPVTWKERFAASPAMSLHLVN